MSSSNVPKAEAAEQTDSKPIRLVIQRFRQATLLVDDNETITVGQSRPSFLQDPPSSGSSGILVYISFSASATHEKVCQAAKTVMNLPVLTRGSWGDGVSETMSICQFATPSSSPASSPSMLIVPQANLISKVKSQGKSIQYHGQIQKEKGRELYEKFVDCIKALALEHQCKTRGVPVPAWVAGRMEPPTKKAVDSSVEPSQMFRDDSVYSKWDGDGIPLEDVHGESLSKSQLKKLRKQYEAQEKRHEKYLATGPTVKTTLEAVTSTDWSLLDDGFIHVVAGTFGNRQGLDISSDMGPFCHVLNL